MSQERKVVKAPASLVNLFVAIDKMDPKQAAAMTVTDKLGRDREVKCGFSLLDENGNLIGEPIESGAFAGIKIPAFHMPPEELFDLEYGIEYIEGFIIDEKFYTREAADLELGGSGTNLQSEDLYKDVK